MRRVWIIFSLLISLIIVGNFLLSGCSSTVSDNAKGKNRQSADIVFADAEWESIHLHNRITGYIIEHGYGYHPRYLAGEPLPLLKALNNGDIDVMMEIWISDYPEQWEQVLKSGKVMDLGCNYSAVQGCFIPAYMVEGDTERGIEPVIPGLKSVQALPAYAKTFKLSATSNKGTVFNAPRGWPAEAINKEKFKNYNLSTSYTLLPSDSEQHLSVSLDKAYERGEAWLGYARDPSIITAGHKMFLLHEDPFNETQWKLDYGCAYPETEVVIAANSDMNEKAPELLDFLQKYTTTREQNEEILLCLKNADGNRELAVRQWLQNNPDVWSQWVPADIAKKIWAKLNPVPGSR